MNDLESIRTRAPRYIGDKSTRGVHIVVFEAIDNAIDQFLRKDATRIVVSVDGKHVIVSDDGAGYPFDRLDNEGHSLGTTYLTSFHDKNTADDHVPHVHCLTIGCGLFCLNALSEKLIVSSWRNGQFWRQEFSRGLALTAAQVVTTGIGRGTTVDFVIDSQIFPNSAPDVLRLGSQVMSSAYLFPGLRFLYQEKEYCFVNGLKDLVSDHVANPESRISGPDATSNWSDRPVFYTQHECDDFYLQAAAFGETDQETEWLMFANGAQSFAGGTHLVAFRQVLSRRVRWRPAVAAMSVTMMNPQFSGPTRTFLDVPQMKKAFVEALSPDLRAYCEKYGIGRFASN
ncbi:MAG: hypothetical protein WD065_08065 [Planctomycetaceae bacterium]